MGTPFGQGLYHIETSQLICDADSVTGFWVVRVFAERCLRTDIITYDSVIIQLCCTGVILLTVLSYSIQVIIQVFKISVCNIIDKFEKAAK